MKTCMECGKSMLDSSIYCTGCGNGQTTVKEKPDQVSQIIAYESGELSDEETVELFQDLINSGLVWKLQGHYGRTARSLIQAGLCQTA